jgi:hypothetical protein
MTYINTRCKEYREFTYTIEGCSTPIVWSPRECESRHVEVQLTQVGCHNAYRQWYLVHQKEKEPAVTLLFPQPLHVTLEIKYEEGRKALEGFTQQWLEAPYSFYVDCELFGNFLRYDPVRPTNHQWGTGIRDAFETFGYGMTTLYESYAGSSDRDFWRSFGRFPSRDAREPYMFLRSIKEIPHLIRGVDYDVENAA